jgi:hypothetical protein
MREKALQWQKGRAKMPASEGGRYKGKLQVIAGIA